MPQNNDIRKGLQDLLGGSKNLDPLEQTIFEKAPQAGFTPPEVQNIYQEGRTIFPNQPVTVDNSAAAWYELGQNAFNIANKTFGDVVDYLIDTKANSVRDIKDMYQAKIYQEYDKLQKIQANNKSSGDMKKYSEDVNVLVSNIRNYRNEWKTKVNEALENGKGSLFTPAIDYWDENLDMKSLGLRYQELAVLARSSDRELENAIRKTEWDAVISSVTKGTETEDRVAMKAGQIPFDSKGTYNLFGAGITPVPTNETGGTFIMPNGAEFGFGVDVNGNKTVLKDDRGQPAMVQGEDGKWYMNPNAGFSWFPDAETVYSWLSMGQNYIDKDIADQSMVYSVNGTIAPDTMNKFEFELSKDAQSVSPGALMVVGATFASLPPGAVAANLAKTNLTAEQKDRAILLSELVKSGAGPEAIVSIRKLDPKAVSRSVNFVQSLNSVDMATPAGVKPTGSFGTENDVKIMNIMLGSVITASLGLDAEEAQQLQEQLAVAGIRTGGSYQSIRDTTTDDGVSLASFLDANPDAKATAMHAMSYLMSNMSSVMGSNGEIDDKKLTELAASFTKNQMAVKGMATFTEDNGRIFNVRNEGYLWTQQFLGKGSKDRMETQRAFVNGIVQTNDVVSNLRNVSSGQKASSEYIVESAKAVLPNTDVQLFAAALEELRVVKTNRNGVNTSDMVGPDVWLPLAAACDPSIQRLYGPPLAADAPISDKIARMKMVLEDISPVSEWGMSVNGDASFGSYARTPQGGIPISFKKIGSKKNPNANLLEEAVGRNVIDPTYGYTPSISSDMSGRGIPVLSVPAYAPRSPRAEILADHIVSARVAALNGKTSNKLSYADVAPNKAALNTDFVITSANFVEGVKVANQLRFAQNEPIGSGAAVLNALRLNGEVLIRVAQDTPELKDTVPLLKAEFGEGNQKRLFNEENMNKIVKEAQAKGAKTMADVFSYVLGVAKARNLNIPSKTVGWKADVAKRAMESTGVPIHKGDFVIPSGPRTGMVLYTPEALDYYDRLKTAAKSGYTIYKDPLENAVYISNTDIPTTISGLEPMPVIVGAKMPNETDEAFEKRFTAAFGMERARQEAKPQIREALRKFMDQEYLNLSEKRQDVTVLPSAQSQKFAKEYAAFRESMGLDRRDVNPAVALNASEYDWPGYWSEYQSFPTDVFNLPSKYKLPIKPSFSGTTEAVKEIRKTYEEPLNQQTLNGIFKEVFDDSEGLIGDSFEEFAAKLDLDKQTLQRAYAFKEAGWTPATFEYQLRLAAKKHNEKSVDTLLKNYVKPNKFTLDSEVSNNLKQDYDNLIRPLFSNENRTELINLVTATGDPRHGVKDMEQGLLQLTAGNIKAVFDTKFNKLIEDPSFNIKFKQQYLLELLSPSGRTQTETTKERRRALLLQALQE
jgi:hypothetical protein